MPVAPSSPVMALANAVRISLNAEDTPMPLRLRLINFISELRDKLGPEQARHLDGLEAEAVITSFAAEPSSGQESDSETPQVARRTPLARLTTAEDISQ